MNADGTIPTDNPFYSTATGNNRAIWALGLRNPFTFAFQPGTRADVHQRRRRERPGRRSTTASPASNYGWPTTEGADDQPALPVAALRLRPRQRRTTGCAITGGAFYNPATVQFPATYVGQVLLRRLLQRLDPRLRSRRGHRRRASPPACRAPVDLRWARDGALYYLARGAGSVGRIALQRSQPAARDHRAPRRARRVAVGQSATFTVAPPARRRSATSGSATAPTSPAPRQPSYTIARSPRPTTARCSAPS